MKLEPILEVLRSWSAVRQWSLLATESRRTSLGIKDREVGDPHTPLHLSESGGARYLVVWDDGRISRGYLERRQLENEPGAALERAREAAYEDPDAAWVLGPSTYPDVALHDVRAAAIAGGDTSLWASRLAEVRRRVAELRLRTWSGSCSAGEGRTRLLTSAGLNVASHGTTMGWWVTLNGEIGDGFSARAPETDGDFALRLGRLTALTIALAEPAPGMAGGIRPVLLHPNVVEEYVLGTLLTSLDGSAVAHGESHFRREQFGSGEPVLREDLTLSLDPLLPLKSGSYRFTTEGVPAACCRFVDAGCLVQPMLDLKYARRLGLPPTPLVYGTDVLTFAGRRSLTLDEGLAAAEDGALVLSVLGVHTQDSASGDFSLSAPQALHIAGGRLGGRLRATLSGNLFQVLLDPALELVQFAGEDVPGLLFPCRLDAS